jgi:hypothetical protein
MKQITYSIAQQYTKTPGPRYNWQGTKSGQDFLETQLLALFDQAVSEDMTLIINLDKTVGYGSSFLEESFGGLTRERGIDKVEKHLSFISLEEDFLIDEINDYISDASKQNKV